MQVKKLAKFYQKSMSNIKHKILENKCGYITPGVYTSNVTKTGHSTQVEG